jgi:hypothetical protein
MKECEDMSKRALEPWEEVEKTWAKSTGADTRPIDLDGLLGSRSTPFPSAPDKLTGVDKIEQALRDKDKAKEVLEAQRKARRERREEDLKTILLLRQWVDAVDHERGAGHVVEIGSEIWNAITDVGQKVREIDGDPAMFFQASSTGQRTYKGMKFQLNESIKGRAIWCYNEDEPVASWNELWNKARKLGAVPESERPGEWGSW